MRAAAFAKSHQPASRASGTFAKLPPSRRPQIQSGLCRPCNPPAAASPFRHQATARVSPGRQTPEHRGPAPRRKAATKRIGFASACHRECFPSFAQHLFAAFAAPLTGDPASHPVSGDPAVRHSGPVAASRTQPDASRGVQTARQNEANKALCERRAGESWRAQDPRPKNPALSRHVPLHSLCHAERYAAENISGGERESFRYASLWAIACRRRSTGKRQRSLRSDLSDRLKQQRPRLPTHPDLVPCIQRAFLVLPNPR